MSSGNEPIMKKPIQTSSRTLEISATINIEFPEAAHAGVARSARRSGQILVGATTGERGTVNGKITERLARVRQEHTASGRHKNRETPFPQWLPAAVAEEAKALAEEEALAVFGSWPPPPSSPSKEPRSPAQSR
jgi:hypothetical protein